MRFPGFELCPLLLLLLLLPPVRSNGSVVIDFEVGTMRNDRRMISKFCAFLLMVIRFQMRAACSSSSPPPLAPALYVFGDSLFDSGNNNLLPTLSKVNYLPYGHDFPRGATGRFTNGRTVADFLAEFMGLPYPPPYLSFRTSGVVTGLNFASGACGILPETGSYSGKCLNLGDQVRLFESHAVNDLPRLLKSSDEVSANLAKSILAFAIGSDDYLENYLNPVLYSTSKTYEPPPFAKLLVAGLSQHLERLYNVGARKFVVFEIGPIGCMPTSAKKSKDGGVCDGGQNLLVSYFNQMLQPVLENMTSSLAGSMFVLGRVNGLCYDAVINPSEYGLTDSKNPCCKTWGNGTLSCIPFLTPCPDAGKHFFWDGYHPTDVASSILASRCFNDTNVCSPISVQDLVQM
ncbi:GDSL esterase/lipase 7-like [Rhodamnia argentea]|uniref:GDSL esterase/lipase 7-like n=1 Tax=Rhodamnia argentea TaxID=178133 RepID=A0ABM3GXD3_9MYRT|nr:GDSL esterase/lipase 7-like [Rhodamnia argentea]